MNKTTLFSSLKFMHKALLTGQIIFIAVIFYLVYSHTFLPILASQQKIMQPIVLIFAAIALFTGKKLYKSKLEQIQADINLSAKEKLIQYRSASILLWALVEAPSMVCGICLLLSGNYAFLALALVIIFYFGTLAPIKSETAVQLSITIENLDEL